MALRSRWVLAAIFAIAFCAPALAQADERERFALLEALQDIESDARRIELGKETPRRALAALLGNVHVRWQKYALFELFADGVAVSGTIPEEPPAGGAASPEDFRLFASGNILVRFGHQVLRCESFFFDNPTRRAVATGICLRTDVDFLKAIRRTERERGFDSVVRQLGAAAGSGAPGLDASDAARGRERLVVFAARLTIDDFERFLAEEGFEVTTCAFGDPHWSVGAERADVHALPREGDEEGERRAFRIDLGGGVTARAGEVPLFPLPPLRLDTRWFPSLPLRDVSYSHSSRFGNRVDSTWNGSLLLPRSLRRHIDVDLNLDYLSKRGTGYGSEWQYGTPVAKWSLDPATRYTSYGEGIFWAIDDRGEDANDVVPEHEYRYRVRAHHRSRFRTGTLLDAEYSTEHDPTFLEEYFEKEAREEKTPETLVYLRQPLGESAAATLLGQWQTDEHRETVERLPETSLFLVEKPLGTSGADLDLVGRAGSLDFEPDSTNPAGSRQMARGDLRTTLAYAMGRSNLLKLRPFFEVRGSAWEEEVTADDPIERLALATGARAGNQFWRRFAWRSDLLGFDGVRHVIAPEVRYRVLFENNVAPSELFQYDEVESVAREERLTLTLKNDLFARRIAPPAPAGTPPPASAWQMLEAEVEADYFPDSARDNGGDPWGPLRGELLLRPAEPVGLFVDGDLDMEGGGDLTTWNQGVQVITRGGSQVSLETRFRQLVSETWIARTAQYLSDRWELRAEWEYDARRHRSVNQYYALARNFHCWTMVFGLEVDEGDDNVGFQIRFGPRELVGIFGSSSAPQERW